MMGTLGVSIGPLKTYLNVCYFLQQLMQNRIEPYCTTVFVE